jgi:hypothetical protein
MTSTSIVLGQQREALEEIHSIVAELDSEAAARLTRYVPGGALPTSTRSRAEYDLLVLESLLIIARAVKGKRRGRRRNIEFHEEGKNQAS